MQKIINTLWVSSRKLQREFVTLICKSILIVSESLNRIPVISISIRYFFMEMFARESDNIRFEAACTILMLVLSSKATIILNSFKSIIFFLLSSF